jgi:uncharacterized protein YbjT (DUF2867 family)
MIRTLVTGATGRLGTALRGRLTAAGHAVRAASRSPPEESETETEWIRLDLVEATGIESALADVDVVIHAATAPEGDSMAVDVEGTKRLLGAAGDVGVERFVYPSIVGIDDIPLSYYDHKRSAESAVEESDVPTTIVRATQFHSFVAELLGYVARLPVWPLPTNVQIQPVDVRDVADVVVGHATSSTVDRPDPVGGPAVHSIGDLARTYRDVLGRRRPIIRIPLPGKTMRAFRAGHATCPDHATGTVTWTEWLAEQQNNDADEGDSRGHVAV